MELHKSWILGLGKDKDLHLFGFPRIFCSFGNLELWLWPPNQDRCAKGLWLNTRRFCYLRSSSHKPEMFPKQADLTLGESKKLPGMALCTTGPECQAALPSEDRQDCGPGPSLFLCELLGWCWLRCHLGLFWRSDELIPLSSAKLCQIHCRFQL